MNKRASLPGASELFRLTNPEAAAAFEPEPKPKAQKVTPPPTPERSSTLPRPSGRVKHDQKITVYFSSDELFALEDAVLQLKRVHGINLDRGRLVRTAVALALTDLEAHGIDSQVVAELNRS
ncbi:hypothetical protein EII34_08025 [Arachnia propionica]|uniref:Uncharacterized protein n=1 Tax=Arachnia propionica TaxID=1750 RepID=A0A3P1T699_9ACTN|nr:hypothetical protein [Arachnia propionica]RRD05021.1 hypothetical protein EII34_08025 [Arachnia propionica]